MPNKVVPFCDVKRYTNPTTGTVLDYGFCYNDNVVQNYNNKDYTFVSLVVVPQLNCLMSFPYIHYIDNIMAVNENTGQLPEGYSNINVPGYRNDSRKLVKWIKVDPAAGEFNYTFDYKYGHNQPIIAEIGVLPTDVTDVDSAIWITFGGGRFRLQLQKNKTPVLQTVDIDDPTVRNYLADVPLDLHNLWKDFEGVLIYIIPLMHGILFSTNGSEFVFIRTVEGLDIPEGNVSIHGGGGVAVFGFHEVVFKTGYIISAKFDTGTPPHSLTPNDHVRGWVDTDGSYSVNINTISTHEFAYKLTLTPGTQAMAVSFVGINFPPLLEVYKEVAETVYDVLEVVEQVPEDATAITCEVTLDNPGLDKGDNFKRFQTLEWDFGWFMDDSSATPVPRNLGVILSKQDIRSEGAQPKLIVKCASILTKVKDGRVVWAPDYSGYTVNEAVVDFLGRNGIPPAQVSMYDFDLTLPEPGEKGNWRPEPHTSSWAFFEELVYQLLGAWVYTSGDNIVHITPYTEVEDATFATPIEFTPDQLRSISYDDLEENLSVFYNKFYVFGLSRTGQLLVAVKENEKSLYDPNDESFVDHQRVMIGGSEAYCTQEICNYVVTVLYNRYSHFRRGITIVTNAHSGNENLNVGSEVKIVRSGVGNSDGFIARSLTSHIVAGEFTQEVFGHYRQL